ncbi:MAG: DUF2796 domain-containing protein [Alishewanella sp.]|nr:DUF2796 domain-containing protein [Alishewanella sp.]MDP5187015.1 DUF2796 domain-containing protein [Alishewanella sp.]
MKRKLVALLMVTGSVLAYQVQATDQALAASTAKTERQVAAEVPELHQHNAGDEHTHATAEHSHEADDFTQLGTHVHGVASLTLILEGNELQLALQAAAATIVGFEHAPRTAEQKQELTLALDILSQGQWLNLSKDANCEIQGSDASTDLTERTYSGHGDFYANISFLCQRPALLQQLDVSLFNLLPSLQTMDVQWVLNGQQGAAKATLGNSQVRF